MVTLVFEDPNGVRHDVKAQLGTSLMSNAVRTGVPGIVAECGGSLSCATCHVYVDPDWIATTGTAADKDDDEEHEMLDEVMAERLPNSRLSCQITVTPELDGILVRIPAEQA